MKNILGYIYYILEICISLFLQTTYVKLKMRIFMLTDPTACINVRKYMFVFLPCTVCREYESSTVASIVYDIRNLYSMGFNIVHTCVA